MNRVMNRRAFMESAATTGAFTIVPRHVLGGPGYVAPGDKLTVAHIGLGTQSIRELGMWLARPEIQIVAVCDPNTDSNDYVDFSRDSVRKAIRKLLDDPGWREGVDGIPGGREVGREVIERYYSRRETGGTYKGCATYADFRELLEKEKDVDAVKIMTPDHLHATVAIAAMKKRKHVVVHKPLANRLYEGRLVISTARETGVGTYFLPWSEGDGIRLIRSWIEAGAIGSLREIHNWSTRPLWPHFPTTPAETPAPPPGFDWDLWLGPSLPRPYHPNYTHALFRGWYEFGGGPLADMGYYSLWPVFNIFDLPAPVSVEPAVSHVCSVVNQVSRPVKNDVSYPAACTLRFRFPERAGTPLPDLYWYDGGMRPPTPDEWIADGKEMPREGMLFVGSSGRIMAGFTGEKPEILPKSRMREFEARKVRGTFEEYPHFEQWIGAFRSGKPSPGSFLNAAAITDAFNLGAVALRTGARLMFDSSAMKITNLSEANQYLYREYRQGWKL